MGPYCQQYCQFQLAGSNVGRGFHLDQPALELETCWFETQRMPLMTIDPDQVRFNGPDELREVCEIIRGRLHSANRIAMGESKLAWEVAEMFGRLGRVFTEADDDLFAEFGNGYTPGTLNADEQRARMIELFIPPLAS